MGEKKFGILLLAKGWIMKMFLLDKPLSDLQIETLKQKRSRNIVLFLVLKKYEDIGPLSIKCTEAATFNCIPKGGGCLNRSLYPLKGTLDLP